MDSSALPLYIVNADDVRLAAAIEAGVETAVGRRLCDHRLCPGVGCGGRGPCLHMHVSEDKVKVSGLAGASVLVVNHNVNDCQFTSAFGGPPQLLAPGHQVRLRVGALFTLDRRAPVGTTFRVKEGCSGLSSMCAGPSCAVCYDQVQPDSDEEDVPVAPGRGRGIGASGRGRGRATGRGGGIVYGTEAFPCSLCGEVGHWKRWCPLLASR